MSKIKVIHFIHGLNTGGAETLVKNYMLSFNQDKFDLVVLCLDRYNDSLYERILEDNGVRVIYIADNLPFKKEVNAFSKIINHFMRFCVVKKIIRRESPEVLHVHLFLNRFVKFARPRHGTKIFYTIHSEPSEIWPKNNNNRQNDFKATRWLVKNYDMRFIVLHKGMQKEVNETFGISNSILLNNGVDIEKIKHTRKNITIRKELGVPVDAFILGHIGRFSRVKNQDFLVDIFIEIARKKENAFLLMVGDGPDKGKIAKKLDDNKLGGRYLILSNRNDVPDLLNIMNVFIFPSLYEGLPLSLIEAQVARKPCFISDTINKDADISNLTTRLSLQRGARGWSEIILSYRGPKRIMVNDGEWDIKKITKELENIYLRALEEINEKK